MSSLLQRAQREVVILLDLVIQLLQDVFSSLTTACSANLLSCLFVCRVVSLCMSPVNDSFMSGSLDHTVRIWDLRVNACQVRVSAC